MITASCSNRVTSSVYCDSTEQYKPHHSTMPTLICLSRVHMRGNWNGGNEAHSPDHKAWFSSTGEGGQEVFKTSVSIPPPLDFIHIPPPQTLPVCLSSIPLCVQQLPIIPQSSLGTELCLRALNRKLTIPLSLQPLSGTSSGSLGKVGTLPSLGSLYSPWTHLTSAKPIATLACPSSSFPHLKPGDRTWFCFIHLHL